MAYHSAIELLDELIVVYKNAPGRHDQRTHAPRVAGVMETGAIGLRIAEEHPSLEFWYEDKPASKWFMDGLGDYDVEEQDLWGAQIDAAEEEVKDKIVSGLSEKTGIDYETVNSYVASWADTSNDNDAVALGLQQAAADEFGVELSDWQKGRISEFGGTDEFDKARMDGRKLLRAMYDDTQQQLKDAGIDEIVLYRGARFPRYDERIRPELGAVLDSKTNAMESWSIARGTAADFAYANRPIERVTGEVYQVVVPRERVISTAKNGFGTLLEAEVVVLGGASGVNDKKRVMYVEDRADD